MQAPPPSATSVLSPQLPFDPSTLPITQLESLKFKSAQILESITTLQRTIEYGNLPAMPAWPEILSKYTVLLSQTHSLSVALAGIGPNAGSSASGGTIFERIAVHPSTALPDASFDNDLIPLLRNNQTTDVLRAETETVRQLAEHLPSRGSLGVLGISASSAGSDSARPTASRTEAYGSFGRESQKKPEYDDVLRECAEVRVAHDARAERAARAVTMLRDKYDWHARVAVEVEEPEELDWDPRAMARSHGAEDVEMGDAGEASTEEEDDDDGDDGDDGDEREEREEGAAVGSDDGSEEIVIGSATGSGTPAGTQAGTPGTMIED
jgi:hypothetical protein